jgi:hypothetical protein
LTHIRQQYRCCRKLTNILVNLLAALIAYTYQEKKPSLNLCHDQIEALELAGF